jgi:hypothetical protein
MNQAEPEAFLEANDILRADRIRPPQAFVEILTIPTAKLRSCVIYIIERPQRFDHTLYLSKFTDITSGVSWSVHISAERKACFVFTV